MQWCLLEARNSSFCATMRLSKTISDWHSWFPQFSSYLIERYFFRFLFLPYILPCNSTIVSDLWRYRGILGVIAYHLKRESQEGLCANCPVNFTAKFSAFYERGLCMYCCALTSSLLVLDFILGIGRVKFPLTVRHLSPPPTADMLGGKARICTTRFTSRGVPFLSALSNVRTTGFFWQQFIRHWWETITANTTH